MDETSLERLGAGKYLLVTSYRKNGTGGGDRVWVVRGGDKQDVWTASPP